MRKAFLASSAAIMVLACGAAIYGLGDLAFPHGVPATVGRELPLASQVAGYSVEKPVACSRDTTRADGKVPGPSDRIQEPGGERKPCTPVVSNAPDNTLRDHP